MRISLSQATSALQSGQVIAVPTETVYGLAACLNQVNAITKIFDLKGRSRNNPLITHLADWQETQRYVSYYPPGFEILAQTFWPALSLVFCPSTQAFPQL